MYIVRIQYKWKQAAGSAITSAVPRYYNLFHFLDPVKVRIGDQLVETKPNACIISCPKQVRGFHFENESVMNWTHLEKSAEVLFEKYNLPVGEIFYPDNPGFVDEIFGKIRREFSSAARFRQELLDSYFQELLIRLARSLEEGKTTPGTAVHNGLLALRGEILAQPTRAWTVEEMAARVALSPSRFHAVYKSTFGASPMKELILARLTLAKSLLIKQDNLSMPEVAERLGYKNQYHFIRQFKAYTGMTPGAYRKHARSV